MNQPTLIKLLLLWLAIILPLHAAIQTETEANQNIIQLYKKLQQIPHASKTARMAFFAEQFLNKPYELGALGEGADGYFDQYPLYRTDAFDCETYVDTVLALTLGQDLDSFKKYIQRIRYKNGHISFLDRNHFTCLDWNPNNQQQGLIKDITNTFHQPTFLAKALIDKPQWYQHVGMKRVRLIHAEPAEIERRGHLLQHKGSQFKSAYATISYIPFSVMFHPDGKPNQAFFDQIPNGAILEIVRPNWDLTDIIGTHLNVSHLGLVLREHHTLYFLQASSTHHKVSKSLLIDYLRAAKKSPTIQGIHLESLAN